MKAGILCAVGIAGLISGCATIVEGTDQTIDVQVSPATASCTVTQKAAVIATLDRSGGQIRVPKSKEAIFVDCMAQGFEPQRIGIESSASGWGVVGCFLIDFCITDYATGALNKYPMTITVRLKQV
jgi:hypothetical protein